MSSFLYCMTHGNEIAGDWEFTQFLILPFPTDFGKLNTHVINALKMWQNDEIDI